MLLVWCQSSLQQPYPDYKMIGQLFESSWRFFPDLQNDSRLSHVDNQLNRLSSYEPIHPSCTVQKTDPAWLYQKQMNLLLRYTYCTYSLDTEGSVVFLV